MVRIVSTVRDADAQVELQQLIAISHPQAVTLVKRHVPLELMFVSRSQLNAKVPAITGEFQPMATFQGGMALLLQRSRKERLSLKDLVLGQVLLTTGMR